MDARSVVQMKINKVKNIIIFGGGTSGWLTAAYITKNLKFPCNITLIESTDIGPIGVGEGTQPATAKFLYDCGIDPKVWMKPSQASFKLGVEFAGWTDKNYFVDNDFIEHTVISPDLFTIDYFLGKDKQEFVDWLPAYQLAKANKSPKLAGLDTNFAGTGLRQFGAVHFSAYEIVDAIKDIVLNKINYVNTIIKNVEQDADGITALVDEAGNKYTADLFIDCSGFGSILLEKTLGVKFISVNDILPCDKAVVMPTQYTNPQEECFPYTRSTAMTSGWRFTIPVFTRIGNGYVYSSKYISPEDAEKELRESLNEYNTPAKHLNMKCGIHEVVTTKNVIAVGLSAGFVEPLEATGITFTTKAVELLTDGLNATHGIWSLTVQREINNLYDDMFWEIVAFIWSHYQFSTKRDTPFWQDVHKESFDLLPEKVSAIINKFLPTPHRDFVITPLSSFHTGQWFSMLNAGGVYDKHEKFLGGDLEKYAEFFIKNQAYRTELVKEMFPNHYDFLSEWYST